MTEGVWAIQDRRRIDADGAQRRVARPAGCARTPRRRGSARRPARTTALPPALRPAGVRECGGAFGTHGEVVVDDDRLPVEQKARTPGRVDRRSARRPSRRGIAGSGRPGDTTPGPSACARLRGPWSWRKLRGTRSGEGGAGCFPVILPLSPRPSVLALALHCFLPGLPLALISAAAGPTSLPIVNGSADSCATSPSTGMPPLRSKPARSSRRSATTG